MKFTRRCPLVAAGAGMGVDSRPPNFHGSQGYCPKAHLAQAPPMKLEAEPLPPSIQKFFDAHPQMEPLIPIYGLPDGWEAPIAAALEALAKLESDSGVAMGLRQIKEKLGGLRIYASVDEIPPCAANDDRAPRRWGLLGSDEMPNSIRQRAAQVIADAVERCEVTCGKCGTASETPRLSGELSMCAKCSRDQQ